MEYPPLPTCKIRLYSSGVETEHEISASTKEFLSNRRCRCISCRLARQGLAGRNEEPAKSQGFPMRKETNACAAMVSLTTRKRGPSLPVHYRISLTVGPLYLTAPFLVCITSALLTWRMRRQL